MITTEALERELKTNRAYMLNVAHRCTQNREDAHDVFQQACLNAWRSRDSFKEGCTTRWWLGQIVRNAAVDLFRRNTGQKGRARRATVSLDALMENWNADCLMSLADYGADPLKGVCDQEDYERVMGSVRRLKKPYRETLLGYINGQSYEGIAESTGVVEGTVRSRLHRARRLLRRELALTAITAIGEAAIGEKETTG